MSYYRFAVYVTMVFDKTEKNEKIQRIRLIMQSLVIQSVGKDGSPARESKGEQQQQESTESGSSTDDEHSDVENPIGDVADVSNQRLSMIQRWKQVTSKIAPNRMKDGAGDHSIENEEEDVCPICIMTFEKGEEACWSKNPQCDHVFHTKCLKPWLMDHSECPCCRKDCLSWRQQNKDDQEKQKKDEKALRDVEYAIALWHDTPKQTKSLV